MQVANFMLQLFVQLQQLHSRTVI